MKTAIPGLRARMRQVDAMSPLVDSREADQNPRSLTTPEDTRPLSAAVRETRTRDHQPSPHVRSNGKGPREKPTRIRLLPPPLAKTGEWGEGGGLRASLRVRRRVLAAPMGRLRRHRCLLARPLPPPPPIRGSRQQKGAWSHPSSEILQRPELPS
jgi:hypothetical protein